MESRTSLLVAAWDLSSSRATSKRSTNLIPFRMAAHRREATQECEAEAESPRRHGTRGTKSAQLIMDPVRTSMNI